MKTTSLFQKTILTASLSLVALLCINALRAQTNPNVSPQPFYPGIGLELPNKSACSAGIDFSNFVGNDGATIPSCPSGLVFPITAEFMSAMLNVLAHKHEPIKFYTPNMASAIIRSGTHGHHVYSVIPGQEDAVVGWAPYLAAPAALDNSSNYTVDASVSCDQSSYLYVNIGDTYTTASNGKQINGTKEKYYHWGVNSGSEYYWFDTTKSNDPNDPTLIDHSVNGEIYVVVPNAATQDTDTWWVSGGSDGGITTGYAVKPLTPTPAPTSDATTDTSTTDITDATGASN